MFEEQTSPGAGEQTGHKTGQQTSQQIDRPANKTAKQAQTKLKRQARWLCIHFPQLPLELAERRMLTGDSHTDKALVIVRNNRIERCSQVARSLGIGPGASLATARSISPELVSAERNDAEEARQLRYLAGIAYRFSSLVSLEPPDAIVLEVSRSQRLFGGFDALADELARQLETLGYHCVAQLADTPLAACALARFKAAMETSTADTVTKSRADTSRDTARLRQPTLASVPLACVGLTERQLEQLANMGLHRLGQLIALPDDELILRIGPDLMQLIGRISGRRPDSRKPIRPRARFSSGVNLLDPMRSKQALEHPMQRLLAELKLWLISHQQGALSLRWRFTGESSGLASDQPSDQQSQANVSGRSHRSHATTAHANAQLASEISAPGSSVTSAVMDVSLARGEQSSDRLLALSLLRLERLSLPEDTLGIRLSLIRSEPWAQSNPAGESLFRQGGRDAMTNRADTRTANHTRPPTKPASSAAEHLPTELVDQLRARLGEQALCGIGNYADHRPERAWQVLEPQARLARPARVKNPEPNRANSANSPLIVNTRSLALRPLWLTSEPETIGHAVNDTLTLVAGPERIESGWWQKPVQRDYYIAQNRNRAYLWVFQDSDACWFIHGYFA